MARRFELGAFRSRRSHTGRAGTASDTLVGMLVEALTQRDETTGRHSCRVAQMTLRLAAEAGWAPGTSGWQALDWAARLHDLGKITVPDAILHKPASLTPSEWDEMRRHPDAAFRILDHLPGFEPVTEIVRAHHERWGGQGYPRGLAGEDIPEGARILALADAFDAMTSERPYRRAMSPAAALQEIETHAGTQFEPRLVAAFRACLSDLLQYVEDQERELAA